MKFRPALVLAIDLTLEIDQSVEGIRQGNDFGAAVDLHPAFAMKGAGDRAQRGARIAPQIIDLVSRLSTADDRSALSIKTDSHRRHLQSAVFTPRRENPPVMLAQELSGVVDVYRSEIRHYQLPLRKSVMKFRFFDTKIAVEPFARAVAA